MQTPIKTGLAALALSLAALGPAAAQAPKPAPYPNMAPIAQYRIANPAAEIALARSAAPASVSSGAEVLTLGAHGYETAVKGKNGFVCLVARAWASGLDDPEFWNPKQRAPICYNAAAARSVLPVHLRRTEWVLAGATRAQVVDRTKAALAAKTIAAPEVGAMCFMMSKQGYLGDEPRGPWHPHLMFFLPRTQAAAWGANLTGAPIMGGDTGGLIPTTVFMTLVPAWSDGTPGPAKM